MSKLRHHYVYVIGLRVRFAHQLLGVGGGTTGEGLEGSQASYHKGGPNYYDCFTIIDEQDIWCIGTMTT
jgi:hypothetical protein